MWHHRLETKELSMIGREGRDITKIYFEFKLAKYGVETLPDTGRSHLLRRAKDEETMSDTNQVLLDFKRLAQILVLSANV